MSEFKWIRELKAKMEPHICAIRRERLSQEGKWGEQNHGDEIWLAILTEEVGEVAKEILEIRAGKDEYDIDNEITQVAAVALSWLEARKRRLLKQQPHLKEKK